MSDSEKRQVYRGLFLVNFLVCLGFGIVDPFFPVYATTNGATGLHLAFMFSGYALAKTLVSPLTGWFSDRRGRRQLVIAGLAVYSSLSLCYLFIPSPPVLIVLRFVQGIGAALVRPVALAVIGDIAPARKEGRAMGTFDISFYGALAAGPVVGGLVSDAWGFPGLFVCLFVLCVSALALTALMVRNQNGGRDGVSKPSIELSFLPRSRTMIALCAFIFTRSFGITLFVVFLPIFMHDSLGFQGIEIGSIVAAATVVTAALLRPVGYLADRANRHLLVVTGGLTAALLIVCLPYAGGFGQLFVLAVGIGASSALSLPASSALLVEEGGRYGMGLTMGVFNGAMNLGAMVAPLAGGLIYGLVGMGALFHAAGIVGVLGILFYFLYAQSGSAEPAGVSGPWLRAVGSVLVWRARASEPLILL